MEKPKLHVVSFSGGKDSTAMLLRMIEENYPIDIILYCDTGLEFPQMEEHIDKVEKYIGRPITRLKAEKDFMYWATEHKRIVKSEKNIGFKPGETQIGYAYPSAFSRWCTRALKLDVIARFKKEYKDYDIIEYTGIAADEEYRLKREGNQKSIHPLAEWGMTEADTLKYCYDRGFDWGGLYEIFDRVSCWCCPLQSNAELRKLRDNFPELWTRLKEMDAEIQALSKYGDYGNRINFQFHRSLTDIERRFEVEDEFIAQGKKLRTKEFFQELTARGIHYKNVV